MKTEVFSYTNGTVNGKELRKIRDQLGWTQVEMAAALGVAPNTVARWERDERAISKAMAKLIEVIQAGAKKRK